MAHTFQLGDLGADQRIPTKVTFYSYFFIKFLVVKKVAKPAGESKGRGRPAKSGKGRGRPKANVEETNEDEAPDSGEG